VDDGGGGLGLVLPKETYLMCDWTPVRNWLIAVLLAIVAAAAIVVGAAVANGSIMYAYLSPVAMGFAAAASAGAVVLCTAAVSALDTFVACAGTRCKGAADNLRNIINAARVVLGIQALACLMIAVIAWIPIAPQPVMWAIIGALVVQVPLIVGAFGFFVPLTTCQSSPG
jgi:hypothetical protein